MEKNLKPNLPLVDVILPTYNRGQLLKQAINSVLNQTYSKFRLIIVDDGSTDETESIIKNFRSKKIIYLKQKNRGRSVARNKGIECAVGKYIAFLDSDDEFLPQRLEKSVEFLEKNPVYSMSYGSAFCINSSGKNLSKQYLASKSGWLYDEISFFLPLTITLPTVTIRRSVLKKVGKFDPNLDRFEDTDLWRRVSKKHMIGAIPDTLCKLRTHGGNDIKSQDPEEIKRAVETYVNKVWQQDKKRINIISNSNASLLFLHYGLVLILNFWYHRAGYICIVRSLSISKKTVFKYFTFKILSFLKK